MTGWARPGRGATAAQRPGAPRAGAPSRGRPPTRRRGAPAPGRAGRWRCAARRRAAARCSATRVGERTGAQGVGPRAVGVREEGERVGIRCGRGAPGGCRAAAGGCAAVAVGGDGAQQRGGEDRPGDGRVVARLDDVGRAVGRAETGGDGGVVPRAGQEAVGGLGPVELGQGVAGARAERQVEHRPGPEQARRRRRGCRRRARHRAGPPRRRRPSWPGGRAPAAVGRSRWRAARRG